MSLFIKPRNSFTVNNLRYASLLLVGNLDVPKYAIACQLWCALPNLILDRENHVKCKSALCIVVNKLNKKRMFRASKHPFYLVYGACFFVYAVLQLGAQILVRFEGKVGVEIKELARAFKGGVDKLCILTAFGNTEPSVAALAN